MMRNTLTAVLASALVACSASTPTQEMSPERLRVLYVANNPDTPEGYTYGGNREYIAELNQTRAAEYVSFLEQYFEVAEIYAEDYEVGLSHAVDVTIFDALPLELQGLDMASGSRKNWNEPGPRQVEIPAG